MLMNEAEYKAARRRHEEQKRRREALEGKEKELFEQIEAVNADRYYPKFSEILCIAKVYGNSAVNSSMDFFKLGFLKGQRAERNRIKRMRRRKSN